MMVKVFLFIEVIYFFFMIIDGLFRDQLSVFVWFQDELGLWYIILDDLDFYLEVLVLVGIVFVLMLSGKLYIKYVQKLFVVILDVVEEDGWVSRVLVGIVVMKNVEGYKQVFYK